MTKYANGLIWLCLITGQSVSGLVRVQPVKFFGDWPKFEGFKSLTPLGESEQWSVVSDLMISKIYAEYRRYGG
jgi:hypothetical protein